jgi:hypothetical protein
MLQTIIGKILKGSYFWSLEKPRCYNGVMDVVVIANLVACGRTPRRKVPPSLLLRLGTLGPWPIKAVARGVIIAPHHLWGVSVREPSIDDGCRLGQLREHGMMLRG